MDYDADMRAGIAHLMNEAITALLVLYGIDSTAVAMGEMELTECKAKMPTSALSTMSVMLGLTGMLLTPVSKWSDGLLEELAVRSAPAIMRAAGIAPEMAQPLAGENDKETWN